jgi:hypothetical protein
VLGNYAADTHHESNPSALTNRFGFRFRNDLLMPAGRSAERDARVQPRSFDHKLAIKIQPTGSDEHPIVRGIHDLAFLSACSVEITSNAEGSAGYLIETPADSVIMHPHGKQDEQGWMPVIDYYDVQIATAPLLAAGRHNRGRVAVCGSQKLCSLDYGDNARLVQNILAWLAGTLGP